MEKIIDLHQDLLLHVTRPELFTNQDQTSFEMIKNNNLKIVVASAFPVPPEENFLDPISNQMIEDDLRTYGEYVTTHPEFIIIKNREDVARVMETNGLFGLLLHIEGLNVFDERHGWKLLEHWYEMGLRSIGPVWNITNPFGGGTKDEHQGLTTLGATLVSWTTERGVLLDFAHMNAKTFWDTTKLVKKPILVSHGNASALCPLPRNYTDEQLRTIGESGGVVGVFLAKKFLTDMEQANIDVVLKHIAYIESVAGKEALAIGSDFGGIVTAGFIDNLDSVTHLHELLSKIPNDKQELLAHKNAQRILNALLL